MADITNYIPPELFNIIRQFYAYSTKDCIRLYTIADCLNDDRCLYTELMQFQPKTAKTQYQFDMAIVNPKSMIDYANFYHQLRASEINKIDKNMASKLTTLDIKNDCIIDPDITALTKLVTLKIRFHLREIRKMSFVNNFILLCPNIITLRIDVSTENEIKAISYLKQLKYLMMYNDITNNKIMTNLAIFDKHKYLRCVCLKNFHIIGNFLKHKYSIWHDNVLFDFCAIKQDTTKLEAEYLTYYGSASNVVYLYYNDTCVGGYFAIDIIKAIAKNKRDKKWIKDITVFDK
jgi:hypothetical protein